MKLSPFELERYFARYEFSAPYLLCCSDCESLSIGDLLDYEADAREEFSTLWLGYTEPAGDPVLRSEIAGLYQGISADQVLVHAGAEEAIFNFMNATVSSGDHVVVHSPCYQSLMSVALAIGARVTEWSGEPTRGWSLDLQALEDQLSSQTTLVVVNFPHNPTGFLPDRDFLERLSDLADEYGFVIFSDEVYRGLEYDPVHRLPGIAEVNERAVSLGVMSKTYGLAGLRIGWVATRNSEVMTQMAAYKDYTTICSSAPSEFLATLALRYRESIVARNLNIVGENLKTLDEFFAAHTDIFSWARPTAGPIAFPQYLKGAVEEFCDDLVDAVGVLLLPGTIYGNKDNCFRIGFGRKNMREGLQRLEHFLGRV